MRNIIVTSTLVLIGFTVQVFAAPTCTSDKLLAFAETKLAFQAVFEQEAKTGRPQLQLQDHATLLCLKNRKLFRADCTLNCAKLQSNLITEALCPQNNGKNIKLTDMKSICDTFTKK